MDEASHDRIGLMVYPGQIANNPEWIELDLEGNLMGHWKLGPRFTADPVTQNDLFTGSLCLYLGRAPVRPDEYLSDGSTTAPTDWCCWTATARHGRWLTQPSRRFHLLLAGTETIWFSGIEVIYTGGVELQWVLPH